MCIQVNVWPPRGGGGQIIDVCDNEEQLKKMSVLQLKHKITKEMSIADDVRLVHDTKFLDEQDLLWNLKIRHLSTVQTLLRLPGGH